jgi:acyl carrier protein
MTIGEFYETISCKVQGSWNIHNVALEQKLSLDFFTMLSSISGVVGQRGQANYAAANVFLDAFASYRQSLGLSACSVDLGVIEDVGYIHERTDLGESLDVDIWTGINESLLHKILRFSIFQQISPINKASASQLITGIPVPQKEDSGLIRDARFGGLFTGSNSNIAGIESKDASKDIQAFFLLRGQADSSTVLAAAVEIVNRQFTKSLRLTEPMEPAKPLSSYGLDSLAAVEFRNWVRMELGAELSTLEITNATSLVSLCEKIIAKI